MSKKLLTAFVSAVIDNSTFEEMDTIYLSNRVMALVGEAVAEQDTEAEQLIDLKDDLVAVAMKNGKIGDTLAEQDILGAELMNLITPSPSQLNRDFWTTYASNPEQAVADFYRLSQKNDYIKVKAIAKNITKTPFSVGYFRRMVRSKSYFNYISILITLFKKFIDLHFLDIDALKILKKDYEKGIVDVFEVISKKLIRIIQINKRRVDDTVFLTVNIEESVINVSDVVTALSALKNVEYVKNS